MNHQRAKKVFTEIQALPYGLSLAPDEESNNCFFKGTKLIKELAILGYAVRGRVGETYWDSNIIDEEIISLLPEDILVTHFFPEVMVDGVWRIVDPTFQPSLEKYGFQIGSWEGTKNTCFPITKLYSQEASITYQERWFNPAYQQDFFERGKPCWRALNKWFSERA